MSPAGAIPSDVAGGKRGDSELTFFGKKISWDAVLIATAGLIGVLFLWRLNKGANVSVGQMPGQMPTTSDATVQTGATPTPMTTSPNPTLSGGTTAPTPSASPGQGPTSTAPPPGALPPLAAVATSGPWAGYVNPPPGANISGTLGYIPGIPIGPGNPPFWVPPGTQPR